MTPCATIVDFIATANLPITLAVMLSIRSKAAAAKVDGMGERP